MRRALASRHLDASYNNLLVGDDDNADDNDGGQQNQNAAAEAVAGPVPAVAAAAGAGNRQGRPASYIRAFFVREQVGEGDAAKTVFRCKLKPDEVGQDHSPSIAAGPGELKSMKRHFESSNFHKKAHEYFVQLISGGMAEEAAIKAVVSRFSPPAGGDIVGPMDAFTKRAKHSATANSLTVQRELAFVCFTIIAGVSFRSAENPYLLAYHEKSNNAEAPPSRKRISNVLLPLLFSLVQQHRAKVLNDVDFFAISTDGWTNDHGEQYIAINASFVDKQFRLRTVLLDFVALPERHTWRNIAHKVAVALEAKMPVTAILTTTVCDNASVMLKAAAALHTNLDDMAIDNMGNPEAWLEPDEDDVDPTALWGCVDHKAQLAALDVLGVDGNAPASIVALYGRLRCLVRHIRQSPKLTHALREACTFLKIDFVKPILDVKTRWLSTWMMGDTAGRLHRAILRIAAQGAFDDNRQYGDLDILMPHEWARIAQFTKILEPVADFVRVCEGEQYVTMASTPVLFLRARSAMQDNVGDDNSVRELKNRLRAAWDTRLGFLVARPNLALAAAALHPAYGHLRFVAPDVREELEKKIADWAHEFAMVAPAPARVDASVASLIVRSLAASSAESLRELYRTLYTHFNANMPADLDILALETVAHDAIKFWQANSNGDLRNLAPFARIVFGVPATSAPSERTFSHAGRLSADRSRSASYKLSMMTVITTYLSEHARTFTLAPVDGVVHTESDRVKAAADNFLASCLKEISGRDN